MTTLMEWLGGYLWLTAFVLGAIHALQPGHGKTLVAAYLVGSRGTVRDAVFLGVVVTITHTAVIYILAAIAQGASMVLPMEKIENAMGAFAAFLILAVGLSLLWSQWKRHPHHEHSHHHSHQEGHSHSHADQQKHDHQSGSSSEQSGSSSEQSASSSEHSHLPGFSHSHPDPEKMTSLSSIFLLGVSGGIVPCPEGLAVFLASLAGGQIKTGLLLVMVFSLGLAATLVLVGILFIKASSFLSGFADGEKWGSRISWISAWLISLVGFIYLLNYTLKSFE